MLSLGWAFGPAACGREPRRLLPTQRCNLAPLWSPPPTNLQPHPTAPPRPTPSHPPAGAQDADRQRAAERGRGGPVRGAPGRPVWPQGARVDARHHRRGAPGAGPVCFAALLVGLAGLLVWGAGQVGKSRAEGRACPQGRARHARPGMPAAATSGAASDPPSLPCPPTPTCFHHSLLLTMHRPLPRCRWTLSARRSR